jgi:hypothetical protein
MLIHNKRLDHVHHKTFVMMKRNYVKKKIHQKPNTRSFQNKKADVHMI